MEIKNLKETPENSLSSTLSDKLRSYLTEDENNMVYTLLLEHKS